MSLFILQVICVVMALLGFFYNNTSAVHSWVAASIIILAISVQGG